MRHTFISMRLVMPGNLRTDAACSVPTFALRVDKVINWKESRLDSVSGFGQNEA